MEGQPVVEEPLTIEQPEANEINEKPRRKSSRFSREVVLEALYFQKRHYLVQMRTMNFRLSFLCLKVLDRPRFVSPIQIYGFGIHRKFTDENGQERTLELSFPQEAPPQSKILGFTCVTFPIPSFQTACFRLMVSDHVLQEIRNFFRLTANYFQQHDLLFTSGKNSYGLRLGLIVDDIAPAHSFRVIEIEISKFRVPHIMKSTIVGKSNRVLLINRFHALSFWEFESCIDWLHTPSTPEGTIRSLIFCIYTNDNSCVDHFIPMIQRRFENQHELDGQNCSFRPKFSIIVLIHNGRQFPGLAPFRLTKEEEALELSLIHEGSIGGRLLSEVISMDSLDENSDMSQLLRGNPFLLSGYILRRDIAVGPWTQPEVFEARRTTKEGTPPPLIHFQH